MKKKLIIFSIANGYGGAEKSLETFLKYLRNDFEILVFASNKKHIDSLKKLNLDVIELKKGNSFLITFKNLIEIKKILKKIKGKYSILSNTNKSAFYLSLLRYFINFKDIKILIFIRDFQWKYQKFIFYSLKKLNPLYLFPSKALFEKESFLISNILNYKIIPNIVDFEECNSCEKYKNYFNVENKIIILPASITRWKGIEYAIKAIKNIDNVILYILGNVADEIYYKELVELVKHLSLENKVKFINFVDEICCFYKNCDLVLNTSISDYGGPETFGRTIIEAWYFKKPVIAFKCGGPKYLIKDGLNGFLVDEKNVEELSYKIKYIINKSLINFNYTVNNKKSSIDLLKKEL